MHIVSTFHYIITYFNKKLQLSNVVSKNTNKCSHLPAINTYTYFFHFCYLHRKIIEKPSVINEQNLGLDNREIQFQVILYLFASSILFSFDVLIVSNADMGYGLILGNIYIQETLITACLHFLDLPCLIKRTNGKCHTCFAKGLG